MAQLIAPQPHASSGLREFRTKPISAACAPHVRASKRHACLLVSKRDHWLGFASSFDSMKHAAVPAWMRISLEDFKAYAIGWRSSRHIRGVTWRLGLPLPRRFF